MRTGASGACTSFCILLLGATVTLPALADDQLEQVIVTAQKRTENVQEVPIAISTFGAAQLEQRGISNVSQLSNFAPNVNLMLLRGDAKEHIRVGSDRAIHGAQSPAQEHIESRTPGP